MDPSTNVRNILNAKPLNNLAQLAWLQIDLALALCWSHRHGAAIDGTPRI